MARRRFGQGDRPTRPGVQPFVVALGVPGRDLDQRKDTHLRPPVRLSRIDQTVLDAQLGVANAHHRGAAVGNVVSDVGDDMKLEVGRRAVVDLGRAGARLGLTQSAISHALNRLRYVLGDELFVRGPEGMQPTERAAEIAPRLRQGLLQLQLALAPSEFDAATTERRFTITCTE